MFLPDPKWAHRNRTAWLQTPCYTDTEDTGKSKKTKSCDTPGEINGLEFRVFPFDAGKDRSRALQRALSIFAPDRVQNRRRLGISRPTAQERATLASLTA